jgi:hypothetical protein
MKVLESFRHIHIVNRFNATLEHNVLEHNDMSFFQNDIFIFVH